MSEDIRLARIEKKVDKIVEHIASIDVILGKQSVILDEHVKRTNLLEARIDPIQKHVAMVTGGIKLILILSSLAGIYAVFK